MSTTISPNMNLPVPVVGVEPGPQWASDINSSLNIIDSHTHTSGSGVPITTAALNINSDLSINNNNVTTLRSTRYTAQGSPLSGGSDLGCVYVSGVDLYYNDGLGNQVRITQSGAVAGTPGSISNLVSPASANYNSGSSTFIWQSGSNVAANMDFGSAIFRNLTVSSNGITLSPPSSLPSNYTLTLPNLPPTQKFMTLDSSGNMSAPWDVDNSTLEVNSNTVQVKASGIGTTQLADAGVTQPKLYTRTTGTTATAGNIAISNSCGNFTSTATAPTPVTNLSVAITTTGRPVLLKIIPDADSSTPLVGNRFDTNNPTGFNIFYLRSSSIITNFCPGSTNGQYSSPVDFIDTPSAGTYTYSVSASSNNGAGSFTILNMRLVAFEIN